MEEELKKLKCELCDEEHFILIQIEVATDVWGGRKGICCKCFNNGNLEEKIFLKQRKFVEDQIESAKEREKYWGEQLKEIIK